MADRVDEVFKRYAGLAERLAAHGPQALSIDDWQVMADVALAMRLAALQEIARRSAPESANKKEAPAFH